eukprot:CAMPEP_0114154220 /NCGR_PEP_ID=MMETSP0043_2-20121206/24785_1 /TAXON_ID=464988 /ORGANISM="Hemiselmis andersenii, Strain CCMP644" /LENGTH=39 /DNA_ID= /DNA_START= /DNA_END= /DNA_ORIENTATION=
MTKRCISISLACPSLFASLCLKPRSTTVSLPRARFERQA